MSSFETDAIQVKSNTFATQGQTRVVTYRKALLYLRAPHTNATPNTP